MSSYSIDTLENLLFETTEQCDLVLRRIMGYLGGAEIIRIKSALTREWHAQQAESDTEYPEQDDDFLPWDPEWN